MARRQMFARFGRQGRLPGATSRDRRNAAAQSIPLTAGAGLKGDRLGRHTLQVSPDSFLYVGPQGLDARVSDDLAVLPGSPRRLSLGASVRAEIDAIRSENKSLREENARLLERVEAQEAAAAAISTSVVEIDARVALIEEAIP